MFDHERLEVYQVALDFLALADEFTVGLPPGRAYLGDQLHRASTSIVLNIAEGAGEFSKKDKARFYRMALRSGTECAALVEVYRRLRLSQEKQLLAGRELLLRIVAMLTRLVRAVQGAGGAGTEKRRPGTGTGAGTGTGRGGSESRP
jgi:four helix bundle protein